MKFLRFVFFLFLGLPISAQDYFPLESTNSWSYRVLIPDGNFDFDTSYYRLDVVGDTLLPNGNFYWHLNFDSMFEESRFVRSDSSFIYIISPYDGQELPFFNLVALPNTLDSVWWGGFDMPVIFRNEFQWSGFGETATARSYSWGGLVFSDATFADGFGITEFTFYGDGQWPYHTRWELIGCQIGDSLYGEVVGVKPNENGPNSFQLYQNYPNPFNPVTTLKYSLSHSGFVTLRVFDLYGKAVGADLVSENQYPGEYEIKWTAEGMASGIYFYQLRVNKSVSTKRMLLLR